ncbi:photosystem II CP47 chlorophyll apoprotein [Striga asiatica]|uniref:Photosystem II CP47 chlorophyll apoprotein n=1 Tax=Striga asiatica TaxID=4170 RepID=A0A5A7PI81_STRAF|nr:photosystem II CP47 chlorophyll apoprotein [Striga asiatica]
MGTRVRLDEIIGPPFNSLEGMGELAGGGHLIPEFDHSPRQHCDVRYPLFEAVGEAGVVAPRHPLTVRQAARPLGLEVEEAFGESIRIIEQNLRQVISKCDFDLRRLRNNEFVGRLEYYRGTITNPGIWSYEGPADLLGSSCQQARLQAAKKSAKLVGPADTLSAPTAGPDVLPLGHLPRIAAPLQRKLHQTSASTRSDGI